MPKENKSTTGLDKVARTRRSKKIVTSGEMIPNTETAPEKVGAWTPEDEAAYNEALKEIEEAEKIIKEETEKNKKREERLMEIDLRLAELDALEKDYLDIKAKGKADKTNEEEDKTKNAENLNKYTENKENKEVKIYSMDFVREEIAKILLGVKAIKSIEYLNIVGVGDEVFIDAKVKAKKALIPVSVEINSTLTNIKGKISITSYNIYAGILSALVEPLVKENLNNISELIKNKIEEKEKTKVEKVWIENGELKAL